MSSCMYSIPEFDNVFFVLFNLLIVSKTSFLDVHGRGCDFFKGVSSLSSVCLAESVAISYYINAIAVALAIAPAVTALLTLVTSNS